MTDADRDDILAKGRAINPSIAVFQAVLGSDGTIVFEARNLSPDYASGMRNLWWQWHKGGHSRSKSLSTRIHRAWSDAPRPP
jgi:hypothetical protein